MAGEVAHSGRVQAAPRYVQSFQAVRKYSQQDHSIVCVLRSESFNNLLELQMPKDCNSSCVKFTLESYCT